MVNQAPDGKVMHATLAFGEATVFLCDEFDSCEGSSRSPESLGGTPIVIHLGVDNCDLWFERAVAAGCTVTMPLQDQFWGDRYGAVADPVRPSLVHLHPRPRRQPGRDGESDRRVPDCQRLIALWE